MSRLPWKVVRHPAPGPCLVLDASEQPVARLEHPDATRAFTDAVLIANAPVLLQTLASCLDVFEVMGDEDRGPSGFNARGMHRRLDELLGGPLAAWSDGAE